MIVLPLEYFLAALLVGAVSVFVLAIGWRGHQQEMREGQPRGWFILFALGVVSAIGLSMVWQGMPQFLRISLQLFEMAFIGGSVAYFVLPAITAPKAPVARPDTNRPPRRP